MKGQGSNQRGVTLIEAMIMAGLLCFIAYGVASVLTNSERFAKEEYEKLKARHVLDRSIAEIVAAGSFFPPMKKNGDGVSYIGCYNFQGLMVKNSNGSVGYLVDRLPDPTLPTQFCPGAKFEVHVKPAADAANSAEIFVLTLTAKGKKKLDYRTTVTLESAL